MGESGRRSAVALAIAVLLSIGSACGGSGSTSAGDATTTEEPGATTSTGADPPAPPAVPLLPGADDPAYRALADMIGPAHGIAVAALAADGAEGSPEIAVTTLGPLGSGVAWSTIKVPMAMAVVDAGGGDAFAEDIRLALTVSDNDAAMRLWGFLGGGATAAAAVTEQLRAGGDDVTTAESEQIHPPYSPYGQTAWAAADQARFALGLRCVPAGPQIADTMRGVVPDQRWGLGLTGPNTAFKGGWGPGTEPGVAGGYLVRQFGIMTVDGVDVGVAIAAQPADGSFDSGRRELDLMATWLVDNLEPGSVAEGDPCAALNAQAG